MTQQRTFEEIAADVRRAQGGDAGAMERILGDVQDMVHYTCLRMLRSEDRAQDAAQNILIAVYQKLGTLTDPMTYMSWVKRITANRCKNILTRTNREFLLEANEEGEDPFAAFEDLDEQKVPDKALDSAESRRMVNDIVDALPDEQRLCVMLYYYDEMKTREIASALQVSEGTVKSRLNYARKSIKAGVDLLAKQGVKLYGGTPLPFLGYILQQSAASAVTPALVGPAMAAASTAAAATAVTAATATAATATTATATTAAAATAATTTAAGLGAFFGTLAGKAVATVIAAAVIGGAAAGVSRIAETRQAAEALAAATAEPTAYAAPAIQAPVFTAAPTPEPQDPVESIQESTDLPEEEADYLLGEINRILSGENDLGMIFDSPVVEIWEIHSLRDYMAFRETDAWAKDVPEGELACYGVRLLDGRVFYVFLGDGRGSHPWDIYSIYSPDLGQYLIRHDYLSGPQWTKWSVEEPPEDALEIESAQGWRSRNVGMAEKDYKGYASLEAAEADADAYITSQRNAFADEYGLEQEQTEMGTASETSSSMTSFVDGDINYSYGYSWDQTSVTFYDVFAPGAPEWETPIGMMCIAFQTYWVKRATFFSPWSDWMTDEEKPAASDNMEIEEATVYRYRTR